MEQGVEEIELLSVLDCHAEGCSAAWEQLDAEDPFSTWKTTSRTPLAFPYCH